MIRFHTPTEAIVSYTSNIPQDENGSSFGPTVPGTAGQQVPSSGNKTFGNPSRAGFPWKVYGPKVDTPEDEELQAATHQLQ